MITAEQIAAAIPTCSLGWAVSLATSMPRWAIDTLARAEMFLAQCAHESAGFTHFVENLNYSSSALMRTWPGRFESFAIAEQYAHQDQKIANHVYANRLGNGPESSGDGWTYRGRGAIQLTGRYNYQRAGEALQYPLLTYPQDLAAPNYGAEAACWYWQTSGLNELADKGRFDDITRRINGGMNGQPDRERWLGLIRASLTEGNT